MNTRAKVTLSGSDKNPEASNKNNCSTSKMASFTNEQFATLLTSLGNIAQNRPVAPPTSGTFLNCTSRFKGEDVSGFLDAITTYKDCANISDENALKGLPLLLESHASTWWVGVKHTQNTFQGALDLLRSTFGQRKPEYKIYMTLFSTPQKKGESIDIFVMSVRKLLSQLPADDLSDKVQLDMIYGLLHSKYRSKIKRADINNFDQLLTKGRDIEEYNDDLVENKSAIQSNISSVSSYKEKLSNSKPNCLHQKYCLFCKRRGHDIEECRSKHNSFTKNVNDNKKNEKFRDTHKSMSQLKETTLNTEIRCYSCQKPGFIKSNCPDCNNKTTVISSISTIHETLHDRPLVYINIFNNLGSAFLDTAAKTSVAGFELYQMFKEYNVQFVKSTTNITLADGSSKRSKILKANVCVDLEGKLINTNFIIFPNKTNSRTLLGIDFIKNSKLILDFTNDTWKFKDENISRSFIFENDNENDFKLSCFDLRHDEGIDLTTSQKAESNQLLSEHKSVFEPSISPTPYAEHRINLIDKTPIAIPAYRLPPNKQEILKQQIDDMLNNQIIEECDAPWAAPVVLVPKPNSEFRLCIDYRKLNANTVTDSYPMPRIDDIIHIPKKIEFLSTIDLKAGYWQVQVAEQDRDKTSFITPFGLFRFRRMPFGLKNAPATFQRLINHFKNGIPDVNLVAYLDDILIFSCSFEQHVRDLKLVFNRLNFFNLKANRGKCNFFKHSVKYLGHIISNKGIETDPGKVSAILEMKPPINLKQLRTFIQTASWFRKFIYNFSTIAKPLCHLTKKNVKWRWGNDELQAFEKLKSSLASAPILKQADQTQPFLIRTDASNYGLGAVLMQSVDGQELPVEYASRLLLDAERNYPTIEREALAVVWALEKFRGYIDGSDITVCSDHRPLKWLMTLQSPSGRLTRWALKIQSFNLKIDYTPGRDNIIADTLSRPNDEPETTNSAELCSITVNLPNKSAIEMREYQLNDSNVSKIIKCFEDLNNLELANWTSRGYLMAYGLLFRYNPDHDSEEPQLVIPSNYRSEIMKQYHDVPTAGHYGSDRTYAKIAKKYYWVGMKADISEYIKNCVPCQKYKPTNLKPSGLLRTPTMAQRFEVLSIDLFGPLIPTNTSNKWIFIITDTATRWTELFALQNATSETCAKVLINEIFLRYGVPRRIVSDNGPQFVSELMQYVTNCFGVKQILTPFYHPEANPVERKNRDLKIQLAILVEEDHGTWDQHLGSIRFAINSTVCSSINQTPAFLNFGREMRSYTDVTHDFRTIVQEDNFVPIITPYLLKMDEHMETAREYNEQQQDKRKEYADAKRRLHTELQRGDLVLLKNHFVSNAAKGISSKFMPRRDGPYIIRNCNPNSYEIETRDGQFVGKYHVSMLTPFRGNSKHSPVRELQPRSRVKKNLESIPTVDNPNPNYSDPASDTSIELEAELDKESSTTEETHNEPPFTRTRKIKKPLRFR